MRADEAGGPPPQLLRTTGQPRVNRTSELDGWMERRMVVVKDADGLGMRQITPTGWLSESRAWRYEVEVGSGWRSKPRLLAATVVAWGGAGGVLGVGGVGRGPAICLRRQF